MTNQPHQSPSAASGMAAARRPIGRPYAGDADLPALEALLASCADREPTEPTRILFARSQPGERLSADASVARLWFDAGAARDGTDAAPVAGALVTGNVPRLAFHVRPDARVPAVEAAVMAWVEEQLPEVAAAATARLDVHLRAGFDVYRAALLERHSFTRVEAFTRRMRRPLDPAPPESVLPPGHRVRPLDGPAELGRYAAAFRDAFDAGPSAESLRERWEQPGHLPELVVEATDGTFVAFCYCEAGHTTQMPLGPDEGCVSHVGTARALHRRGFGRAALRAGLRQLRERGMRWAVMQTGGGNEPSRRLFDSEGFSTLEMVPRLRYVKRAAATGG